MPSLQVEDPYRFLAVQGTLDIIEGAPDKVVPVIPQVHNKNTDTMVLVAVRLQDLAHYSNFIG